MPTAHPRWQPFQGAGVASRYPGSPDGPSRKVHFADTETWQRHKDPPAAARGRCGHVATVSLQGPASRSPCAPAHSAGERRASGARFGSDSDWLGTLRPASWAAPQGVSGLLNMRTLLDALLFGSRFPLLPSGISAALSRGRCSVPAAISVLGVEGPGTRCPAQPGPSVRLPGVVTSLPLSSLRVCFLRFPFSFLSPPSFPVLFSLPPFPFSCVWLRSWFDSEVARYPAAPHPCS